MGMLDDSWRPLAGLFSVGMVLVAGILVGYFGGSWLDGRLSTQPWFMVVGVLLGAAAGVLELFRNVNKTLR